MLKHGELDCLTIYDFLKTEKSPIDIVYESNKLFLSFFKNVLRLPKASPELIKKVSQLINQSQKIELESTKSGMMNICKIFLFNNIPCF